MSMLDRTLFGELRSISTCPTNVLSCRQQLSKEASTRALPPHSVPLTLGVRRNAARWTPKILAMDKRSAELKSIGVCTRHWKKTFTHLSSHIRLKYHPASNTADRTRAVPDNICLHSPVSVSQILAVPSSEVVSTKDPSVEKAAEHTHNSNAQIMSACILQWRWSKSWRCDQQKR